MKCHVEIDEITDKNIPEIAAMQAMADRKMDLLLNRKPNSFHDITEKNVKNNLTVWMDYFNTLTKYPAPLYQGLKAVDISNRKIIGCIFTCTEPYLRQKDSPCVEAFFVHPDYWGQGVGKTLMSAALDGLRKRNLSLCRLWAEQNNERIQVVYQRLGWEKRSRYVLPFMIKGRVSQAVLLERNL